MKKYTSIFAVIFGVFIFLLTACVVEEEIEELNGADAGQDEILEKPVTGTYSFHIGGYDWGPAVDTVYVEFNEQFDEVPKEAIIVSETKEVVDFTDDNFPVIEETFELKVTRTYFVDANYKETNEPTQTVGFDIAVDPDSANPLLYSADSRRYVWSDPYYLSFKLAEDSKLVVRGAVVNELKIEQNPTNIETVADDFDMDSFEATDGTHYEYAYYSPEEKSDSLFVWLHGGTEGAAVGLENTDSSIPLLANKASILSKDEFQKSVGNAHVLVPQSPTMWMDMNGQNFYTIDGSSTYEESLRELILYYKEKVGAEKVILAGPSNGGYMTLRLAVLYPDDYDALIPIAHGYNNHYLSDEDLKRIRHIPMFFIYAEEDDTLLPIEHSIPSINRLRELGADDIKVSSTRNVVDTSGKYTDEWDNPYTYNPHWTWIYFLNNETADDKDGILIFDWIGKQFNKE